MSKFLYQYLSRLEESKQDIRDVAGRDQSKIHEIVWNHIKNPVETSSKVISQAAKNSNTNLSTLYDILRHDRKYSKDVLKNTAFHGKLTTSEVPEHMKAGFLRNIDPSAYTRTSKNVHDYLYHNLNSEDANNVRDEHMSDVAEDEVLNHHLKPTIVHHIENFKRTHSDSGASIRKLANKHGHEPFVMAAVSNRKDGPSNKKQIQKALDTNPITVATRTGIEE